MMTYEERSLLLLEPCCVHIHRQHGGGVPYAPKLPKGLNVGGGAKESFQ